MASPRPEVFFLLDLVTRLPMTGQLSRLAFLTYKDTDGHNLSQPTFVEFGGGFYGFYPVFANLTKGILYAVDTGLGASPDRLSRYMRPEDYTTDDIPEVRKRLGNRAKLDPVLKTWTIYDDDGVTALFRFTTFDKSGNPSVDKVYERVPT